MKRLIQLNIFIVFFLCGASCTQTKKIPAHSQSDKTLKEAYKDVFLMGMAVNDAIVSGRDKSSQDIVVKQFNSITLENAMKAALINPQPGVFNFAPADAFVAFGEAHKMFIIGHTLVWHNQVPAWFFTNAAGKSNTKEEQIERLRTHIKTVAGRYAGRVRMGCSE